MEDARLGEPLDDQHGLADLGLLLGEQRRDVAADHLAHEVVDRGVGDRAGGDVGAVAHDRDGVAQVEDLVEAVRDEQQRATLVAQAAGDGEEPLDLDAAERRGRLVHDEHLGVERDRLGDLDDLLVGDRQAERRAVGVDPHAEAAEQLERLGAHELAVDAAERAGRLAAHEDVLGDRQVGEERRLLVDDGDAGGLRLRRAGEVDGLAVEQQIARVAAVEARDDLDERRLAGAVLADQGVDRAALEREASGAEGDDGAERLDHPTQFERGCLCGGGGVVCHRSSSLRVKMNESIQAGFRLL